MIKQVAILFFVVSPFISGIGQNEKYFELTDTSLEKGMVCVKEIQFSFSRCMYFLDFQPMIDSIAKFLHKNANLVVEISDHVDSRGDQEYNIKLSECRIGQVVDNLINQGIPKQRIVGKGYGHSKPRILEKDCIGFESAFVFSKGTKLTEEYINSLNDQTELGLKKFEDAHRLNRRIEIKILQTGN